MLSRAQIPPILYQFKLVNTLNHESQNIILFWS